jgi:Putative MetA-pathway of phenol degradation
MARVVWSRALVLAVVTVVLGPGMVWAQPAKEEKDIREEAEEARRAMDVFLRQEKVLIRRGELWLELDSFYSTDTRDDFLVAGFTEFGKVTTQVAETSLVARYGLLNNLELDVRAPFVWVSQEIDAGVTRLRNEDYGLGDVTASLKYQVWREGPGTPDISLSLDGRAPTATHSLLGAGQWGVGATIGLVKTLDPVVFFGRVGYLASIGDGGRDPGDVVAYQFGIGYSLNDRVSLTTQLAGGVVVNGGENLQGSDRDFYSLQFSVTVLVTKHLYMEPFVSVGLSQNAPDVIVGLSLPYRF